MSSSENALSRVVTHSRAAIFLLRCIFHYITAARAWGKGYIIMTKVTLSTHIFYYARCRTQNPSKTHTGTGDIHGHDGSIFLGDSYSVGSVGSGDLLSQTPLLDPYATPVASTALIFTNKNQNHIIDTIVRNTQTTGSDRCGVLLSEM
ncbi:hypothetical protein PAXRUDRAFT_775544 [Paxillus rubicundulus Ve08.2h10]|uniref:Uncharacterized protein n=1 Tax=Paxillus rubicundulus Ve08.2h10 TaxID=930991 RepID=A0A0D0C4A0_9AGAM|nr:hypothetical protein PAXRUDRAFT_775544 [Paxillus rubicundulus Ve08.2h10]